ncbi:ribosomal protein S18 acetylase RimI-like enzyme [Crossiella equi]|uniref:Ribosomal protein S18 acetylase RimI-like enzyme n=1 Tax=Crossiella equi TaxID=130796 RepID=A0ABS5ADW5_9PSEU|nr:GNAT family N-acetyltransferase [Crossiella equi]MBP2474766.1 ribosomal protein S18 acetylase RimI-like enzyme [Crossiella equi]
MAMMRLTEYSRDDRDDCLRLFDTNVPLYFAPGERAEFARFLDRLPGPYLVGRINGALVAAGGHAPARDRPGVWTLCWGMVERRRHKQGLGRALLEARLRLVAADPDAVAVVLSTSQHSTGFFEHLGFRVEKIVPQGFAADIDQYDLRLDRPELVARFG